MLLTRWNPTNGMNREIDRLFENFLWGTPGEKREESLANWTPRVDIENHDKAYILHADIPGMKQEDIKISVEKNVLTISGERQTVTEEKKENFSRVERFFGSFSRSFTLPDNVDAENIEASYKQGVLEVTLPKKADATPRRIEVKVE